MMTAKEQNDFILTDGQRLLRRCDVEGICPTPEICFEDWKGEQTVARCGPCAVKASARAGIEISQYTTSNPQAMRLQRELNAAEARIKVLEAALEPFQTYAEHSVNADGWIERSGAERIWNWFGPSDFQAALAAKEKQ